jgi:4-amino-4-deoxy-L-arabinose transferase-like glycosyltransferase
MEWTGRPGEWDRRDWWLAAATFVAAVIFQLPIFDRWLALLDEGYVLQIADDINRGRILYRDVVVDAPFPLSFELLAAWFRIFGTSVFSSRLLAVLFFALYASSFYCLSREVLRRTHALLFVWLILCYRLWAFPHWQFYSYSLVAASLALVAAATLAASLRRESVWLRFLGGIFLGMAIAAKQDYGAMVSIAFGLLLLLLPWLQGPGRPKLGSALLPAFQVTLGAFLVVLPIAAFFAWHGALPAMIQQTVIFPFSVMSEFDYTRLPDIRPFFSQDPALRHQIGSYFPSLPATLWWKNCEGCLVSGIGTSSLYTATPLIDIALKLFYWSPLAIVCVAGGATGLRVWRERGAEMRARTRGQLVVMTLALGFLAAFNKPRDWVHLMMIYPPILLALAMLAGNFLERASLPVARVATFLLAVAVVVVSAASFAMMIDLRRSFDYPLGGPRGFVFADRLNGPLVAEVLDWQREAVAPGVPLPVYPTQPAIAFLSERETAGGFHVIWPMQGGDRDATIIADIERRGVDHLVFSISQWGHLGSFEATAPDLYRYLVENFEIRRTFSREIYGPILVALERSSETPPTGSGDSPLVSDLFTTRNWPFAEIQSQVVGSEENSELVRFSLSTSFRQATLEGSVGINPDRWFGPPAGPFDFIIEIEEGLQRRVLLRKRIDPRRDVEDRHWHPFAVDLTPYAGHATDLLFRIDAPPLQENPQNLAGWKDLRFIAE